MPNMHEEIDWELIVDRIKSGQCTPFLGAGACYGELPLASEIAENWAKDYGYPMKDFTDLARVAEFLAIKDPLAPKEKLRKRFKTVPTPDFMKEDEPHGVLADLPFPIYITTNYDDFMEQALKSRNKDPKSEVCLWYPYPSNKKPPSVFDSDYVPTPEKPVVFHLHGRIDIPDSLVLTEDDYLDFLKKISEEQALLPPPIEEAFTANSLLFLGYWLADWNFRVIFRSLKSYLGGKASAVATCPSNWCRKATFCLKTAMNGPCNTSTSISSGSKYKFTGGHAKTSSRN